MSPSEACIGMIKSFEGYHTNLKDGRCKSYLDKNVRPAMWSKGYKGLWTIGWGCTGPDVTANTIWSRAKADMELRKIADRHAALVEKTITVPLNQNQFDALVSLSYNLGLSKAPTLIKRLNAGDYDGAAKAFDLYTRGGGVVLPGLVRRRKAERKLFESKVKPPTPVEASRDLSIIKLIRKAISGLGVTATIAMQFVGDVWTWFKDNPSTVAFGMLAIGAFTWAILKWIETSSVNDYLEGRYTPSGYND